MAINNNQRSFQYWAGVAAQPPDFNLDAGIYGITLAAGFTTATLQRLIPDGTGANYVTVSAVLNPSSYVTLQLPAGQYKMVLVAPTAFVGLLELIARGGFR